ncbi:MAG: VOC family protein [Oscillospiraceae bacterium]
MISKISKVDHVVITTADIEACTSFYRALGFRAENAGGRWELFSGDFKINVHVKDHELEPKAAHVQTGSADLCFEIDGSLELCRRTLIENGIEVELGIVTRHGVRGEMRSIYLRDPDGNLIELCSYE